MAVIDLLIASLKKRFCQPSQDSELIRARRFFHNENVYEECCIATFLDPRFKHNFFREVENVFDYSEGLGIVKARLLRESQSLDGRQCGQSNQDTPANERN